MQRKNNDLRIFILGISMDGVAIRQYEEDLNRRRSGWKYQELDFVQGKFQIPIRHPSEDVKQVAG